MKLYGSINNRFEENRMYCDEIKVGTGMTEYMYSDRHAYEVTNVIDQKHVMVREYDHKHVGEAYENKWELISNPENPERLITRRGDLWYWTNTLTAEELEKVTDVYDRFRLSMCGFNLDKVMEKGKQTTYRKANVSFGVANYYYDYEF